MVYYLKNSNLHFAIVLLNIKLSLPPRILQVICVYNSEKDREDVLNVIILHFQQVGESKRAISVSRLYRFWLDI